MRRLSEEGALKKQIGLVLIILWVVICRQADAYFQEQSLNNTIKSGGEQTAQSSEAPTVFHLYDNLLFSDENVYLNQPDSNYIPAGEIKLQLPINIKMGNWINPEQSIDSMSLLILKIHQLINRYSSLQKNVGQLIATHQQAHALKTPPSKVLQEPKLIQKKRAQIIQQFENIGYINRASQEDNSLAPLNARAAAVVNQTRIIVPGSARTNTSAGQALFNPRAGSPFSDGDTKRGSGKGSNPSDLPWVFRVLLNAINFLNNNRIEIGIAFSVFILVGTVFAIMRER